MINVMNNEPVMIVDGVNEGKLSILDGRGRLINPSSHVINLFSFSNHHDSMSY